MANKLPGLTNGSIIRIKADGIPIAHATDHSYQISVMVASTQVMGSLVPIHEVTDISEARGSFTVLRMLPAAARVALNKNMIGNVSAGSIPKVPGIAANPAVSNRDYVKATSHTKSQDGMEVLQLDNMKKQLDPNRVFSARTFDLDIYMVVPQEDNSLVEIYMGSVIDCNLTGAGLSISMNNKVQDQFSYHGKMVFKPRPSGKAEVMDINPGK